MKARLTIIFLSLLIPVSFVFSQVLSQKDLFVEGLFQELGSSAAEDPLMPEDELENEKEKEEMRRKKLLDLTDKNYGFTGKKSFVNPPQSKVYAPLRHFGYDFFVNAPTTFAAVKSIPILPNYVIGPGDNVKIILYGTESRQFTLQVTREGDIFFPEIGSISIAGLTFQEMKETVEEIVSIRIIGTQVNVTMGSLRSINIFVLGDAYQPGMYTISALSSLTNAIFISGGVSPTGSLRNIQLKRNGEVIAIFDFYELLLEGNTSNDSRLMEGDVVFIPPVAKTVGISGEVSRPGIYELKQNENLKDLIRFSGSLKPKANIYSSEIERIDLSVNGYRLIPVKLDDSSMENFDLSNGDVLRIDSIVDSMKSAVLLTGHAQRPGFYSWKEGMRLDNLIQSTDDLLTMTDMRYVLIKRENKLTQSYEFLQTDLEVIFNNPASEDNLLLFEKDEIILFPSLLTTEQITTKLIKDEFILQNDQLTMRKMIAEDDEWTSLSRLRKSLTAMAERNLAQQGTLLTNPSVQETTSPITGTGGSDFGDSQSLQDIDRYYEFSIYDYCTLPGDILLAIVTSSSDVIRLGDTNIETSITNACREQLLEPLRAIIERNIKPGEQQEIISVFGNTHFPGTFPLTVGMDIEDALKASGGLKEATYAAEIELSRSDIEGKKFSVSNSSTASSDSIAMTQKLQAMDIINVKQVAHGLQVVSVQGEVYFSGDFPISENQTLGDLIRRAGGVTEYGDYKAAIFQRQSIREAEAKRLTQAKSELQRAVLFASQSTSVGQGADVGTLQQLTSFLGGVDADDLSLGRLVIDLEAIMDGTVEDIVLEDGDIITIPKYQQTVSVIGEVYVQNAHIFRANSNIDDYINFSGGLNTYADENSIYLIKSDGSIVSPSQLSSRGFFRGKTSTRLEAGDTIVVPLEVKPFSAITATTEITQIIYQMAIAAAAVSSF